MNKTPAVRAAALLALLFASPIFAAGFERPAVDAAAPLAAEIPALPAFGALQLPSAIGALPAQNLTGDFSGLERGLPAAAVSAALAQPPARTAVVGQAAAATAVPQAPAGPAAESARAVAPAVAPKSVRAAGQAEFRGQIKAVQAALEGAGKPGAQANAAGGLDALFSGSRPDPRRLANSRFTVNDDGVLLRGRAASDYGRVKAIEAAYKGKINFSETLGVMDDAYAHAYAKISILQAVARGRRTSANGVRLNQTLQRVDGIVSDGGRRVAVATEQVFFHHAQNPASEIAEGIRRVDDHLAKALGYFAPGGQAERQFGRLDEVILGFDTRGYPEIKAHLQDVAKKLAASSRRIRFVYLDEVAPVPQGARQTRDALNALIQHHKDDPGLSDLMGGIIHSRYTGLLLEMETLVHYYNAGYQILQSGREFFDAKGFYVTELDAVVRSPEGKTILVEAKSARDSLPPEMVLSDKVEYKMRGYQARRAELEAWIGRKIDEVVFAMDVGFNLSLQPYLLGQSRPLAQKYGFPTGFLFMNSPRPGQRRR
ncbi:MAG TPA: hypothetical protein VNH15_08535 [Elusimicrobiota bacterium]|nr:hypothetical protein [Elusimicrobiota bacterium]